MRILCARHRAEASTSTAKGRPARSGLPQFGEWVVVHIDIPQKCSTPTLVSPTLIPHSVVPPTLVEGRTCPSTRSCLDLFSANICRGRSSEWGGGRERGRSVKGDRKDCKVGEERVARLGCAVLGWDPSTKQGHADFGLFG